MITQQYTQYIDFDMLQSGMQEILSKKSSEQILNDLPEISCEATQFLQDLLLAESSSQLDKYSDAILDKSMSLLNESEEFMSYLSNLLDDSTILAREQNLIERIKERHLNTGRRLL